jgi:hypothetical protein
MLQALLHGKLDGELKRDAYEIEDLLTSVVIGTCSYLEPSVALVPFLSGARDVDGKLLDLSDVQSVEYEFWQPLAAVPRGDAHERAEDAARGGVPEVLISVTRRDGSNAMLVIEAKLFSGKSAWPSPKGPVTDQLGKYWLQLEELARKRGAEALGVLYLTRGVTLPREDFAETQHELREKRHMQAKLYWLSWRAFVDAVRSASTQHRLLRDVVELLEKRWYMVAVQMQQWPRPPTLPTIPAFIANWRWQPPPRLEPWGFEARGGLR